MNRADQAPDAGPARRHAYVVASSPSTISRRGGVRTDVTADQLPILQGMAFATLILEPRAAREPHWHPNAAELSYCIDGLAQMTIVEPSGSRSVVDVEPGDLVYVPPGYLHDVENLDDSPTRFALCFAHERYQDLNISSSVAAMPARVVGATFGIEADLFEPPGAAQPAFIVERSSTPSPTRAASSPYRYELERLEPHLDNAGGSVRMAHADNFPILKGLAMYSLRMKGRGVREPHWHPNASELNYLLNGRVKLTIVSPGGDIETFDLAAGELSFIPPAYFHYIENLGDEEVRMLVFFGHELPSDIGISGGLSAYSDEVLGAVFNRSPDAFASLPRVVEDVLLAPGPVR